MSDGFDIRSELTSEQRTADMQLMIDPGFVNHRLVETVLPPSVMDHVKARLTQIPNMPEGLKRAQIDHVYSQAMLAFCEQLPAPSLPELLARGKGRLFSSTLELAPTPNVYDEERVVTEVLVVGIDELRVELHYSTKHIGADTTKTELHQGGVMAVIAELHRFENKTLQFHPLIMGGPWLTPVGDTDPLSGAEWYSFDFFEVFIEDIDEFAKVREGSAPDDFTVMGEISENAFKTCLAEILGDAVKKDWGGETSDHFSAHVHLNSKPKTGAFLLKGPAKFAPMGLNNLGKNNDQIYRLSHEPAQLLVVQHCHEILPAVRATLRAFAVQPGLSRFYCLIDGRDSLRLLQAYGMLEQALELSEEAGS